MRLRTLFEALGQEVAIIFGRFNPPHKGHRAAWELASKSPVWFVGTNQSTVGPKDPLPYDVKLEAMKTIWPEVEGHIIAETSWLTMASKMYEKYPDATLLCFTDEDWVTKTIVQYNGKEGAHGFYNFKNIEQRQTPRLSSATALRDAVLNGDKDAFSKAAGVDADTDVAGKPFFDLVSEYLLPYQDLLKKIDAKKAELDKKKKSASVEKDDDKKKKQQKKGALDLGTLRAAAKTAKPVNQDMAEAFGPLPKDNQQIRLGKYTVDIERVGLNKNYIGFAWHDSQGQEHYEEVPVGDLGSYDDLIDKIKQEIRYKERKVSKQDMEEGSDDDIWGPQGNFAGDTKVNIGGVSMKKIQVGDIVTYFGEKAKVLELGSTQARITANGKTWNVRKSDLKQLGQGVSEGLDQEFDMRLAKILKQRGYKGPLKLEQLGMKWIEAIGDVVDIDDYTMVQGNDPDYDGWVSYVFGLGKYAYGAEQGYTTGTAKRVEIDTRVERGVAESLNEAPIEMDPQEPMNPMIYGHDKANPAKLKYRMLRASNQMKDLAQRAESAGVEGWDMITRDFKELSMNIEQIRHALEELRALRSKGGVKSRGIEKF